MKTHADIVAKLKERQEKTILPADFMSDVLVEYLGFDDAILFIQFVAKSDEDARSEWRPLPLIYDEIVSTMRDYMVFAWGKVQDHRAISAGRSVQKMRAWLWLLDRDSEIDWNRYRNYGAPILQQICNLFDFPVPDDSAIVQMSNGERCKEDCTQCLSPTDFDWQSPEDDWEPGFVLTAGRYYSAVWYLAFDGWNILAGLYRDGENGAWHFMVRTRFYKDNQVFDSADQKRWMLLIAPNSISEDDVRAKIESLFDAYADKIKPTIRDRQNLRSDNGLKIIAILNNQPWWNMKIHGLSDSDSDSGSKD
jgi:hypothetical protein